MVDLGFDGNGESGWERAAGPQAVESSQCVHREGVCRGDGDGGERGPHRRSVLGPRRGAGSQAAHGMKAPVTARRGLSVRVGERRAPALGVGARGGAAFRSSYRFRFPGPTRKPGAQRRGRLWRSEEGAAGLGGFPRTV